MEIIKKITTILKSTIYGFTGMVALLVIYFSIISLISGWSFALSRFGHFWYFLISLAVGFGIQIGLYTYLRNVIHQKNGSGGVLAVSGTTSTAAMLSCCAHYLIADLKKTLPFQGRDELSSGMSSSLRGYPALLARGGCHKSISNRTFLGRRNKRTKFYSRTQENPERQLVG